MQEIESEEILYSKIRSINNPKEKVNLLLNYCSLNKISKWKECIEIATLAKKISEKINYEKGVGIAYLEIGYQYWFEDKYDLAHKFLQKSCDILKNTDGYFKFSRAAAVNASILWSRGNRQEAIAEVFDSLSHVKSLGLETDCLWLEWFLGIFYFDLKDYENSEKQYIKALGLIEELKFKPKDAYVYCLIGLGGVLLATERGNEALDYFLKGKKISSHNHLWMQQARVLHDLGSYFKSLNNQSEAKKYFFESYKIRYSHNTKPALISSLLALVEVKTDLNNALILGFEALSYSKEMKMKEKILESHQVISKVYKKLGEFEKSNFHLEEASTIKDQLLGYKFSLEIKNEETKFVNELINIEVKNLKNQNESLKKANETIDKQLREIKRKNNEKAILLKEIHHRVKNSLQLTISLIRIQRNQLQDDQEPALILKNSETRIAAIALVHEFLYQDENVRSILLGKYLEQLISTTLMGCDVDFKIQCPKLRIKTKLMTPLALIISELLSNTLKHGFSDKTTAKEYSVFVLIIENNQVLIRLIDNGQGLPVNFKIYDKKNGLGLELVGVLSEQINADVMGMNTDYGSEFQIRFVL